MSRTRQGSGSSSSAGGGGGGGGGKVERKGRASRQSRQRLRRRGYSQPTLSIDAKPPVSSGHAVGGVVLSTASIPHGRSPDSIPVSSCALMATGAFFFLFIFLLSVRGTLVVYAFVCVYVCVCVCAGVRKEQS